ncbi:hypothetical protein CO116_02495 [Candidatus Falkowbacteria bacterium CG_4_9_14_3_um_filter_38_19]|uniref:Uncharacterized protein n=2 Tax=Candidatus Falkowiibacteriota TaxID=1752728 RepID=A0A2M6WSC6_9BACT|nr:MAG: hypothetical protein COT96_00255 [Candidatus Falkowbacteria bacterium CG10_big_fil_rev_8_21_14_0_10_38_22]PJB16161.1 MAG: hypothetical protein CO116_02495 [Candidatus Falkowbacteria bacterium CG_4_9_14_3_um_filter_38_19]
MTLSPKQFNKIALKEDLNRVENKLDKVADDVSKLVTAVDGLAKNVSDFQAELASNQMAHDRMQKYIESLDKRITKVELRTGIKVK